MSELELKGVSKSFGSVKVVREVSLSVDDGEFVVFVGPSGCGKSTLLRLIAGLEKTSSDEIRIGARDVTNLDPSERGVAMVFQSYALYPHMNVEENIGFGLRMNGMSRSDVRNKVTEAASILHLEGLLKRKPRELSGGHDNASPSGGRSSASLKFFSSTSRCPTSTRNCACRCASRSPSSTKRWVRR